MSPLIESIALHHGIPQNLTYHQKRMSFSAQKLWNTTAPDLNELLHTHIPISWLEIPLAKARLIYDQYGQTELKIQPYLRRKITELVATEIPAGLDYAFKFWDRSWIDQLCRDLSENQDILLHKNGWIQDSSYANVALLKKGIWYTPARPLLQGTCLMRCIDEALLRPAYIHLDEVHTYEKIKLINALLGWEKGIQIETKKIWT